MPTVSFTAHTNGQVIGQYTQHSLALSSEGANVREAWVGLQARTGYSSFSNALAAAMGPYLAPKDDPDLDNITKTLPAYSAPCWHLIRTQMKDLQEIDGLLTRGALFETGLVHAVNGFWRPNEKGLEYLKFIKETPLENMRVGIHMLRALSGHIIQCIVQGTIQTNLPFIEEAMKLGLMTPSGHAAKLTDKGCDWFFLVSSSPLAYTKQELRSKDGSFIFKLAQETGFPLYGDRAQLLKRLPPFALGKLLLIKSNGGSVASSPLVDAVVHKLPLAKWAALSIHLKGTKLHREITKGLKAKIASQSQDVFPSY